MKKLFLVGVFIFTLFFCAFSYAQISVNITKPIGEQFTFDLSYEDALQSITKDLQKKNDSFFFNENDSIILVSDTEFHVVGQNKMYLNWVELASPISEIAYNELKEKVDNLIYTIEFKKVKDCDCITINSYLRGFKLTDNIQFFDLDEQGLLAYSDHIKFSKRDFIPYLTKYLWNKTTPGVYKSVAFSKENGFDNQMYAFANFIPKKELNIFKELNAEVPTNNSTEKEILITYTSFYSTLTAINKKTFEILWQRKLSENKHQQGNRFSIYNGTIYATTEKFLFAINITNGDVYWKTATLFNEKSFDYGRNKEYKNEMFKQFAPVSDNKVFVSDQRYIYCFNRFNGDLVWAQEYGIFGLRRFHFDDKFLYKSALFEMFKIEKATGKVDKILHNTKFEPLYHDQFFGRGILIFGDENGNMIGYDTTADKILWENDADIYYHEAKATLPNQTDKPNFIIKGAKGLFFIDWNTGKMLNHLTFDEDRDIENYFENDSYYLLYFSNYTKDSNDLYIINKEKQELEKIIPIPTNNTPISNFQLNNEYILTYLSKNELILLDLKTGKFTVHKHGLSNVENHPYFYIDWNK